MTVTITTIEATDILADSRAVINTNFGNLKTDADANATTYAPIAKGVTNGDTHDHVGGDGSAIVESAITLADNTTNDVSITKHGFVPKAPNDTSKFLRGDGTWAISSDLWTDGGGSITPNNVTGATCELVDAGWWNMDRTVGVTTGDQYGMGAGVIRATAGSNNIVPAVFHSHAQGTFVGSAWGIALEAWTGNHTTEGTSSANLIGCEVAVYGQTHDMIGQIIGFHAVFKNRPDGVTNVLHGSVGTNKYNSLSEAIRISSSGRSSSGEYGGWNKGIVFQSGALDRTTSEGNSTLIDFMECTVDNTGGNPWIIRWRDDAGSAGQAGIKYNTTTHNLEFWNGLDTTPTRRGYINMLGTDHAL